MMKVKLGVKMKLKFLACFIISLLMLSNFAFASQISEEQNFGNRFINFFKSIFSKARISGQVTADLPECRFEYLGQYVPEEFDPCFKKWTDTGAGACLGYFNKSDSLANEYIMCNLIIYEGLKYCTYLSSIEINETCYVAPPDDPPPEELPWCGLDFIQYPDDSWLGEREDCSDGSCCEEYPWGIFYNGGKYYQCLCYEADVCPEPQECQSLCGNGQRDSYEDCDYNDAESGCPSGECSKNCKCERSPECTGTLVGSLGSNCACYPTCPTDCLNSFFGDFNNGFYYCQHYGVTGCEPSSIPCTIGCGEDEDLDGFYTYPDGYDSYSPEMKQLVRDGCGLKDCFDEKDAVQEGSVQEQVYGEDVCQVGCCKKSSGSSWDLSWAESKEMCGDVGELSPKFMENKEGREMCFRAEKEGNFTEGGGLGAVYNFVGPKLKDYMRPVIEDGDSLEVKEEKQRRIQKYSACSTCINPDATEVCDGIDNNCGKGQCVGKDIYPWTRECTDNSECDAGDETGECVKIDEMVTVGTNTGDNIDICVPNEQCVWYGVEIKEYTIENNDFVGGVENVNVKESLFFAPGGTWNCVIADTDAVCGYEKDFLGRFGPIEISSTCPDGWMTSNCEIDALHHMKTCDCTKVESSSCLSPGIEGSFLDSPFGGLDFEQFLKIKDNKHIQETYDSISWNTACVEKNTCIDGVDNDGVENFEQAIKDNYNINIIQPANILYNGRYEQYQFDNLNSLFIKLIDVDDPGCYDIKCNDKEHEDYCGTQCGLGNKNKVKCYCLDQDADGFCGCAKDKDANGKEASNCNIGLTNENNFQMSRFFPDCDDYPGDDTSSVTQVNLDDPNPSSIIGRYQYYDKAGFDCCYIQPLKTDPFSGASLYDGEADYFWIKTGDCKDIPYVREAHIEENRQICKEKSGQIDPAPIGQVHQRMIVNPNPSENGLVELGAQYVHPFAPFGKNYIPGVNFEDLALTSDQFSGYCWTGINLNCNKGGDEGYDYASLFNEGTSPFTYDTSTGLELTTANADERDAMCNTKDPYLKHVFAPLAKEAKNSIGTMVLGSIILGGVSPLAIPFISIPFIALASYNFGSSLADLPFGTSIFGIHGNPMTINEGLTYFIHKYYYGFNDEEITYAMTQASAAERKTYEERAVSFISSSANLFLVWVMAVKAVKKAKEIKMKKARELEGQGLGETNTPAGVQKAVANPLSGTSGCFLAGTKILMKDLSYKNIKDIQTGESVVAFNLENESPVNSSVLNTFIRNETEYLIINYKIVGEK